MSAPTALPIDFGSAWVGTLIESFVGRTDALGELDRRAGDGDFGSNIATALRLATVNIERESPVTYTEWVTTVSRGFLGVGGTSGPLFGMFFRDLARCTAAPTPSLDEFARGLAAGVATVQRYGKAEVGHKTMVDAMAPAADALTAAVASGMPSVAALDSAASAAVAGARSTSSITAKRGRASYVGEVSRGVLDPGAAATAIILQAAALAAAGAGTLVDTAWIDD